MKFQINNLALLVFFTSVLVLGACSKNSEESTVNVKTELSLLPQAKSASAISSSSSSKNLTNDDVNYISSEVSLSQAQKDALNEVIL